MRLFVAAVIVAVATAVSVPASAQGTGTSSSTGSTQRPPAPKKPPAPRLPLGLRAFAVVEAEQMLATKSFDAVTGSPIVVGYGGIGEVLNVWKRIFVRAGMTMSSTSGERGFVVDDTFLSTGVKTDIEMRTIEVGAGWRAAFKKHPKYAIYFGGGVVLLNYKETSQFAEPGDNVDESFRGYAAQVGLELMFSKWISAAFEGQYRTVPSDPALNSIQGAFREDDLGGIAIRGMIGIRLKK